MLYANDEFGNKVEATEKGARATCPHCKSEVLAKCGEIKEWHWAHIDAQECDLWSEPESEWHRSWKKRMSSNQVEVTITKNGKRHRADILTAKGMVIEIQRSPISPEEIREREMFYGNLAWLFDVQEPVIEERLNFRPKGEFWSFRWKHPRKHIAFTKAKTYLDIGGGFVLWLQAMYPESPCGGWGYPLEVTDLIEGWRNS